MATFTVDDVVRAYKEKSLRAETGMLNVDIAGHTNDDGIISKFHKDWYKEVGEPYPTCALGAIAIGLPRVKDANNRSLASIFHELLDIDYWKFVDGFDQGRSDPHPDTVLGKACRDAVLADSEIPKATDFLR